MNEHVAILGDGAMATVCAILLTSGGHRVTMWGALEQRIERLLQDRENRKLLPGVRVPESVRLTANDAEATRGCTMVLSAVPTQYMRSVWERIGPYLPAGMPIVSVAKGIENETLLRPTEVIGDVLRDLRMRGHHPPPAPPSREGGMWRESLSEERGSTGGRATLPQPLPGREGGELLSPLGERLGEGGMPAGAGGEPGMVVLSGPNIAAELARYLPATAVAASADAALAERVQGVFSTQWFRVYTNNDVIGVELAGATKNVIAIAAGILDGLAAGNNAKSALVTRGLVEITRLGMAMGAQAGTFQGLAGLGDLITTCVSPEGRNRRVGEQIGKGRKLEEVLGEMDSVAEGVPTTRSVRELARRHWVEMPITEAVHSVLFEGKDPIDALTDLMTRDPKPE